LQEILSRFVYTRWSDPEKKRIVRGTLQTFIIQGFSVALVFAGNMVLTRWAGADAYGRYVHVFNWVSILAVAVTGGREDLVLTEITRYHSAGETGRIAWLIRRTNLHVLLASLLLGLVFSAIIFLFPIPTLHEYRFDLLVAWGAVYFTAFLSLNQAILQSLNYIRLSQVVERLARPLLLFLIFGAAWLMHVSAGSRLLIILAEITIGCCCILLAFLLLAKTRSYFAARQTGLPREPLTKKTLHFFLITLMTMLVTKITMLILPYFAGREQVGIYNIASRFSDLVIYPFFLMHAVLPQLFARHTLAETAYKQSLYRSVTKMMTALCLPLLLLDVVAGKFLLGLFGQEFVSGYTALVLLSISQLFYSLFGPANTVLMMQNQERESVICLVIYILLLTGLNLVLVPLWGITGGATAALVCCLIYNILLAIRAYRLSGVISPFFAFLVHAKT